MPESGSDAVAQGKSPGGRQSRGPAASGVGGPLLLLGNHGVPASWPVLLDSDGCSVTYTRGLEQETLTLDSSGDRKSELKVPAWSGLGTALFWALTLCPHVVEDALVSLLIKTLVPSQRPHFYDLIQPRSPPKGPISKHHRTAGLGRPRGNVEGTQSFSV